MSNRTPILVTGSHRSGSTWVGKMISACPSVGYIHEPLHLEHRLGVCGAKFPYTFPHISNENGHLYYTHLKKTFTFKYNIGAELKHLYSFGGMGRSLRDWMMFTQNRLMKKRALIKDPFAIFSADWLYNRFRCDVIVIIRHPAAFVYSLVRLNWKYEFGDMLRQPTLMENLKPYKQEIETFASSEHSVLEQGILLWKIFHHVISRYRDENPSWLFLRHEDISREPIRHFAAVFKKIGLHFSASVRQVIEEHTAKSNKRDAGEGQVFLLKRDSAANILTWKEKLNDLDISKIRSGVEPLSSRFYSVKDW